MDPAWRCRDCSRRCLRVISDRMDRLRFRKGCGRTSARRRSGSVVFAGEEIELAWIGGGGFFGGGKGKVEAETLREALTRLGRKAFEVIVDEAPDAAGFVEMPLELEGPALERSLAFPKQFAVTMDMLAVGVVLRRVIAEKPQVDEVGGGGKEFERREIAFVESAGIGPNPADSIFFHEANVLRPMPAGMAKLDGEAEIARELREEGAQQSAARLRRKGRRQLNQDDVQLRREWFDSAEKTGEFGFAIAQHAFVSDRARKFAGEAERSRGRFDPAANGCVRRRMIEGRIYFHRREIARVEFQPARRRQVGRIKIAAPFFEAPCAGAEPDFLLSGEVQDEMRDARCGISCILRLRRPVQLDGTAKLTTLRNAMKLSFRILFLPLLICLAAPVPGRAAVVFKPGEKARFQAKAPGEEEMSGTAQQLFE